MTPRLAFNTTHTSLKSRARCGVITLNDGRTRIETPAFVPVATNGAMKSVSFAEMDALHDRVNDSNGCDSSSLLVFANTLHFIINSDPRLIREAGGLPLFTGRRRGASDVGGAFITDSGGFQIFSFGKDKLLDISTENGYLFRSYRNGDRIRLTPESSIEAQHALGAHIILVLDELIGFNQADETATRNSMSRSMEWAMRSAQRHRELSSTPSPALYGILHGGPVTSLRCEYASFLNRNDDMFDGYAIGGSLGEASAERPFEALSSSIPLLNPTKPRHLLGIGDTSSIYRLVRLGIDTFDSSFPTMLARHGAGVVGARDLDDHHPMRTMSVKSPIHRKEFHRPLDPGCLCPTCGSHSLAYLHHLHKAREPLLGHLLSVHNLFAMFNFMARIRREIREGVL